MTAKKVISILTRHNKWRRGDDSLPMQEPRELGKAIDWAVDYIEQDIKAEIEIDKYILECKKEK